MNTQAFVRKHRKRLPAKYVRLSLRALTKRMPAPGSTSAGPTNQSATSYKSYIELPEKV